MRLGYLAEKLLLQQLSFVGVKVCVLPCDTGLLRAELGILPVSSHLVFCIGITSIIYGSREFKP